MPAEGIDNSNSNSDSSNNNHIAGEEEKGKCSQNKVERS